jgi:hypothetical protein
VSELTKCNWHNLQDFIAKYGEQNLRLEADENWICVMRWTPKRPVTEIDYSIHSDNWEHIASFLALTTTCVC